MIRGAFCRIGESSVTDLFVKGRDKLTVSGLACPLADRAAEQECSNIAAASGTGCFDGGTDVSLHTTVAAAGFFGNRFIQTVGTAELGSVTEQKQQSRF